MSKEPSMLSVKELQFIDKFGRESGWLSFSVWSLSLYYGEIITANSLKNLGYLTNDPELGRFYWTEKAKDVTE